MTVAPDDEREGSLAAFSNLSVVDREVLVSPPESFVADFQLCFRRRFLLFFQASL